MGVEDVMTDVREEFYHYPEAKVYLSKPPVIPGLGTAGGFELQLEARGGASFEQLVTAVDTFMMYAGKEKALTGLSSSLQAEIPQLYFDVDRDKAKFLGIPMADIFSTMKAYTGSVYVNDFNMFNRIYRVYIQAEAPYRMHADDINLFFVRAASGEMVPLTALGTAEYTTGPGSMRRFNMFSTAVIRGNTAPGYSSGEAMRILEDVAKNTCPKRLGWNGADSLTRRKKPRARWDSLCCWCSYSYSCFWLHCMKAGWCRWPYCCHCLWLHWEPIWEFGCSVWKTMFISRSDS